MCLEVDWEYRRKILSKIQDAAGNFLMVRPLAPFRHLCSADEISERDTIEQQS